MKLLCLCSALDLKYRYGCTPAWWQFFKGLYEERHDVIAVPYQGVPIESPWWRAYSNPCQLEGTVYSKVKRLVGGKGPVSPGEGVGGKLSKAAIEKWVRPQWEKHLEMILSKEKNIDAVIVFTIPVNHFTGIPERLGKRFGVPFIYYDGDVPASLPRFGGFASGFKIYEGADLGEYAGVLCNSEGGADDLREMGAKRVETVHWGVDPDLYAPLGVKQDWDLFFYGYGIEYRERWFDQMLVAPSRKMEERRFMVGGRNYPETIGKVKRIGDVPFNKFREVCCRSKINLNITREAHATVRASSSMRIFELAAMGCCMVSNPYEGLDTWFDVGEQVIVVNNETEALHAYERLLGDEAERKKMGEAARQRVLDCHTHRHRARQIASFVKVL